MSEYHVLDDLKSWRAHFKALPASGIVKICIEDEVDMSIYFEYYI